MLTAIDTFTRNYYMFQESTENIEDSREDEGDEVDAEVMK